MKNVIEPISTESLAGITGGLLRLLNTPEEHARGAGWLRTNTDRKVDFWQQAYTNKALNSQYFDIEARNGRFPELPPR